MALQHKAVVVPTTITKQHWIQRITFAAETNAADTHTRKV